MSADAARAAHAAAVDAYQLARLDGDHKQVRRARRDMREAARARITAEYAVGLEPSDYMAGALPSMFKVKS